MTINVDTSASSSGCSVAEEALSLLSLWAPRICPVCLRLTCSIKNRPKFVPIIGCSCPCSSACCCPCFYPYPWHFPTPLPALLLLLLDYKFLGVCVPCAECRQQLRLNSNWHLMISCLLSSSLSLFLAALATHSHCPAGAAPVPGTPPAPTLPLFGGGGNGPPAATSAAAVAAATNLSALASQHRLLELSRFGLRGYDLAQHMLSQQGAVSKLLGKCKGGGRGGCGARNAISPA